MTHLESLAAWALALRPGDIPARVRRAAELQRDSVLGSLAPGATCAPGAAARRAALSLGARGDARVFPDGERVHPCAAVLANAAASMAHDYDDYLFLGHTGHSAVLASLATTQDAGHGEDDALCSQVAANEIAGRLGAYVSIGPQNGQLWSHIHLAAGAIAAARAYRLDAAQASDALAIAFYQPPYSLFPGFFASDAKLMTAAAPAASGIYAARLAAEGLRGPRDILAHRRGFGAIFSFAPVPEVLGGLGEAWVSDSLSYKIYPGCAYIDGPVDAALIARGDRPIDPREVERIDITATALTAGMERLGEDSAPSDSLDHVAINFSAKRSVAIALLAGRLTPDELHAPWLDRNRDAILTLASRTRLRESRSMTVSMLDGIGRAVSLPKLARTLGPRRLWEAKNHLESHYRTLAMARRQKRRRSATEVIEAAGETLLALGSAVTEALGGAPFSMAAADFTQLEFRFGAHVEVHLASGERLRGEVIIPRGAAGRDPAETAALMQAKVGDGLAFWNFDDS